MQWMELIVHTTTEAAELVAELLEQAGAKGASIEDRNDLDHRGETAQWDIVDADVIEAMPEDVLVHAYFPVDEKTEQRLADACGRMDALLAQDPGYDVGSLRIERKQVDDTDWAEHWKQYYKPFRAGKSLVVKPTWEPYEAAPGDLVIEMDPGMAFGTGTHETTALCMEMLERWQKPRDVVMDVGCGSGILAIAA
ncbi:MAG TPA: 50S ribosomal protein L11 methyltransferase, partial [Clostridia bacterium]|nr:50S ribosomal protein L11 methyltransferase [Clostridia bacterium]